MISSEIDNYIIREFGLINIDGCRVSKINEGFSGAKVFMLEILKPKRNRMTGVYILKIIDNASDSKELEKSNRVYSEALCFQNHLVKVMKHTVLDNRLILILEYAAKRVLSTISLSQLKIDEKIKYLKNISYDLLAKLNAEHIEVCSENNVIESLCTYRIQDNGNFVLRIKKHLEFYDRSAFSASDEVLPNPLYYLANLSHILKNKPIQFIKGILHGDLHQKNIFILKNTDQYVVIDYDSVGENFLLFDQAYLELNIYMQLMEKCDLEDWVASLKAIFDTDVVSQNSGEYEWNIAVSKSIQEGIQQWYEEEMPQCMDNYIVQLQLARIAAGINFFSKYGITNSSEQIKYLIYIGFAVKKLFSFLEFKWNKNNISRIGSSENNTDVVKKLWSACGKFHNEFIKVLITDDSYPQEKYNKLQDIAELNWRLIVDVGEKKAPNDLMSVIIPEVKKYNGIRFIDKNDLLFSSNESSTGILELKLASQVTKFEQWREFRKCFKILIKSVCNREPFKAVLFVLDLPKTEIIRKKIIEMLWEEDLIRSSSRFVCFGDEFELPFADEELEEKHIKIYQHPEDGLIDIAAIVDAYGLHRSKDLREIKLPCIESLDGRLSEEEWKDYSAAVEIVYPGCESEDLNYNNGLDFYKGNEIGWLDLAQQKDIKWEEYEKWKGIVLKKLQTERVAECKLMHGAGAGGTTLAKRLMWDIKDSNPTLRIKKYGIDTANVVIDIYRKTGKCVFAVVEMGSTIVSEDELDMMKRTINAQSCRVVFLRVERTESKEENSDIYLSEELNKDDANTFYHRYCEFTDDPERKKNLSSITYEWYKEEWSGQKCPFFYGFYTFQEEYEGLGRFLTNSILHYTQEMKDILIDLAVISKYSQNICMPYPEMQCRLKKEKDTEVNLVDIYRYFGEGIEKILILKENGFRICHPLIAQKLIELLNSEYSNYSEQLFYSTIHFIKSMNMFYGEMDRDHLDEVFRELLIDRSYIDGEHQKFAMLIQEMQRHSLQTKVFEKLKELYPDNPHYYNHLGRLQIYPEDNLQFEKAISNLQKAVKIATDKKLNLLPHYTTLGCIYSKKAIYDLREKNKSASYLLNKISVDFDNASNCFLKARKLKEDSTYAYFPNILMICNVVKSICKATGCNISSLMKDPAFEEWYDYYSGIAVQLYEQMKNNCEEELTEELRGKAIDSINYLRGDIKILKARMITLQKGYKVQQYNNLARTTTMLLYMSNNYKWENMNETDLAFAEREMEHIIESGQYRQNDINAWFNIYRQTAHFDVDKAKRYLLDYMEEGYQRSYLMWLLSFIEYEKGIIGYSDVEKYLSACKYNKQLVEKGIRTTRYIDAYSTIDKGFPIRRSGSLKNENGEYVNLKLFRGQITDIDGTVKGKIQLNDLSEVTAIFTPSFMVGDQKREFNRSDISSQVEFGLMFTYSGYKAWDVHKV